MPTSPSRPGRPDHPGRRSRRSSPFTVPASLTSLELRLSDATAATDGGSILVYLVSSNSDGSLPATTSSTSNKLASPILLATILDSSLAISGFGGCIFGSASATISTCNTLVKVNDTISTPGDYWIALVDGSDTNNGGTNTASSGAVWWRSGDNTGLNAAGLTNAQCEHVRSPDLTGQPAQRVRIASQRAGARQLRRPGYRRRRSGPGPSPLGQKSRCDMSVSPASQP